MNTQHKKNPLKKLISLAGVAGASVFLGLPGFAEITPNAGDANQPINNSDVQTEQLVAQDTSRNGQSNFVCEGYEGNPTSGGGYFCSMQRRQFSNRELTSQYGTSGSQRGNEPTTTGAGYPGNNVTPQGQNDNMNQDSMDREGNTQEQAPGNVTPQGGSNR